jgi:hypothetical protein
MNRELLKHMYGEVNSMCTITVEGYSLKFVRRSWKYWEAGVWNMLFVTVALLKLLNT